jgi:hypothetical protein
MTSVSIQPNHCPSPASVNARGRFLTHPIASSGHISERSADATSAQNWPRGMRSENAVFSPNMLMRLDKRNCGASGAKFSGNYATSLGKPCSNASWRRKFIVSKFRQAMVASVSGSIPVAEDRGHLQGQTATVRIDNGKRGLTTYDRVRFAIGPQTIEDGKRTNTRHV